MKRKIVCLLLVLLLGFGCAPAAPVVDVTQSATETPAMTEAPTPEPTAEPTPELVDAAPIALFGLPYNVFSDIVFPAGYTVYGARFDCASPPKNTYARYALYLTAEGTPRDIALYFADLLGINDETQLNEIADLMERDVAQDIYGTYQGVPAFAMLKKTEAGNDFEQCTEVNGCRIELAVDISADQTASYFDLILQNNNSVMLGELAPQLGEETLKEKLIGIFVNAEKPEKTEVYLQHRVENAAALMASFNEILKPVWFDEQGKALEISYGRMNGKYQFDTEQNIVFATLRPNDNSAPVSAFIKSEKSLIGLGFQLDEQSGFYLYDDKETTVRFEIANPDSDSDQKYDMLFICIANGYLFGIWYNQQQQTLVIQTDKDEISAKCTYRLDTETFEEPYPSEEMVQEHFALALGSPQGDVRQAAIQEMSAEVQNRFGLDWQELCALPVW